MESSFFKRYFRVTSGPLMEKVKALVTERDNARKEILLLGQDLGAEVYENGRGGVAGFKFKTPPNEDTWRKPTSDGLYLPRKNTPSGKKLWERIKALPKYPSIQDSLSVVGLYPDIPCIFDGEYAYKCCVFGFPAKGVLFVSVPWKNITTEVMEKYKTDKSNGNHFNTEMDFLQWEPPSDWSEIKEWEMLKEKEYLDNN